MSADPLTPIADRSRPSSIRRFWSRVSTTGVCWEWNGALTPKGYGSTHMRKNNGALITTPAHRRAWQMLVGEIPGELTLDHLCRNKRCVNPDHLELVTRAENSRRATYATEVCVNGHPYSPRDTLPVNSAPGKRTKRCRQCLLVRAHQRRGLDCSYGSFCSAESHHTREKTERCRRGHDLRDAYIRPDNGNRQCRQCIQIRRARKSCKQWGGDEACRAYTCTCHRTNHENGRSE